MDTSVNKPDRQVQDDEISLKELILKLREWYRYLLSKWKVIVLAGVIGGLLGLLYAYFKKPVYTAECTFVLEEQGSGGALGQYAGLASMVGIDLGGTSSNGIFQGDNIIELYKSRAMIQKTLLSKGDFNGQKQLLINRFIELNQLKKKWRKDRWLSSINFDIPRNKYGILHDSIINIIVKDIKKNYLTVVRPDKKLSIISVQVNSTDQLFAKKFAEGIVANVNSFYVQTKIKKSSENLAILQRQADSVRGVLNSSFGAVAAAMDANPSANAALAVLRVPSQRRQVDIQANSAIYTEVVKNLELARISLRKAAPLIQIIDTPVVPLPKDEVGILRGASIGAVLASFIVILWLAVRRFFKATISG